VEQARASTRFTKRCGPSQPCPGRQIPSDRYSDQQTAIHSGVNKIYVLTQFKQRLPQRHVTQTYNLSAAFGKGFLSRCSRPSKTPDSPSWFEGTAECGAYISGCSRKMGRGHYLNSSPVTALTDGLQQFVDHHIKQRRCLSVGALPVDQAQAKALALSAPSATAASVNSAKSQRLRPLEIDEGGQAKPWLSEAEAAAPYLAFDGIYVFNRHKSPLRLLARNPHATDFR